MPLDTLYFSPHDHAFHGDGATTDLIGTVHTPDEVYVMKRFMAGQDRSQHTLFPESLEVKWTPNSRHRFKLLS